MSSKKKNRTKSARQGRSRAGISSTQLHNHDDQTFSFQYGGGGGGGVLGDGFLSEKSKKAFDEVGTPPTAAKGRGRKRAPRQATGLKKDDPLSKSAHAPSFSIYKHNNGRRPNNDRPKSRHGTKNEVPRDGNWYNKTSAPATEFRVPRKGDASKEHSPGKAKRYFDGEQSKKSKASSFANLQTNERRRNHQRNMQEAVVVDLLDDDADDENTCNARHPDHSDDEEPVESSENIYSRQVRDMRGTNSPGTKNNAYSVDDEYDNKITEDFQETVSVDSPVRKKKIRKGVNERSSYFADVTTVASSSKVGATDDSSDSDDGPILSSSKKRPKRSTLACSSGEEDAEDSVYDKGTKRLKSRKPPAGVKSPPQSSPPVDSTSPDEGGYATQEEGKNLRYFNSTDAVRHCDDEEVQLVEVKQQSSHPNLDYAKGRLRKKEDAKYDDSPELREPTYYGSHERSPKRSICTNMDVLSVEAESEDAANNILEKIMGNSSTADKALLNAGERKRKRTTTDLLGTALNRTGPEESSERLELSKKNGGDACKKGWERIMTPLFKSHQKKKRGKPLNHTSTSGERTTIFSARTPEPEDPIEDSDEERREGTSWRRDKKSKQLVGKQHSRKKRKKTPSRPSNDADNPIEIGDSDDEDEELNTPLIKLAERRSSSRLRQEIELARVTVGKRLSHRNCKLELNKKSLVLEYEIKSDRTEKLWQFKHEIKFEDIHLFKYHSGNELALAILRVVPTEQNCLSRKRTYVQDEAAEASDMPEKGYIVLEFRIGSDLEENLIRWMKGIDLLNCFVDEVKGLSELECQDYAQVMLKQIEDVRKDREDNLSSPRKRRRSKRRNKKQTRSENQVLLVFPFGADEQKIDDAANGLTEAREVVLQAAPSPAILEEEDQRQAQAAGIGNEAASENVDGLGIVASASDDSADDDKTNDGKVQAIESKEDATQRKGRAHYLTIRDEDFDRLEPGEFLNDTLIDFWMQWLMRKEDRETSPIHVFTSHFYTTLSEEGPAAVESWTAKKNIDIFSKNFIFIPINKHLHWSLCVVVNPGAIESTDIILGQDGIGEDGKAKLNLTEEELEQPVTSLIFLDSLKAHQKKTVLKHVRKWLNAEWKRVKTSSETQDPFKSKMLDIISPTIPYQDNSWDCGVFVCRYAYAIFMRRHECITIGDYAGAGQMFKETITYHDHFEFNMEDIGRLRREIKDLVTRLSVSYKAWNEEVMAEKKRLREEEKENIDNGQRKAEKSLEGSSSAACDEKGALDNKELVAETKQDTFGALTESLPDTKTVVRKTAPTLAESPKESEDKVDALAESLKGTRLVTQSTYLEKSNRDTDDNCAEVAPSMLSQVKETVDHASLLRI